MLFSGDVREVLSYLAGILVNNFDIKLVNMMPLKSCGLSFLPFPYNGTVIHVSCSTTGILSSKFWFLNQNLLETQHIVSK